MINGWVKIGRMLGAGMVAAGVAAVAVPPAPVAAHTPAPAEGAQQPRFFIDVQGWQGGPTPPNEQGFIRSCSMGREYQNPAAALFFLMGVNNQLLVGVADRAGTPADASGTVRITVDQAFDQSFDWELQQQGQLALARLGENEALIDLIKRGNVMTLSYGHGQYRFPLTGTFAAFDKMVECLDRATLVNFRAELALRAENLVPSAAAPADGIDGPALFTVLGVAGLPLAVMEFANPEDLPQNGLLPSYLWVVPQIQDNEVTATAVGGVHQQSTAQQPDLQTFMNAYMAQIGTTCSGEYAPGLSPVVIAEGDRPVARGQAVCNSENGPETIHLFFIGNDRHHTAFFHLADGDAAPLAQRATNLIEQALLNTGQPPPAQ